MPEDPRDHPIEPTVVRPASRGSEPTLVPAGGAAPAPLPVVPQGKPFGRYLLMQELGHGGMGVVWKAWDTQLRRIVALKGMLGEEFAEASQVERFMREARAAARLSHPNIVPVYDVGEQDGQHYFTAEYIEGLPLDAVMKTQVAPKQAIAWVKAVAEGLSYAHEQGVVHRDVKPGNVLIDRDGQPHVMDFGLAKQVEQDGSSGPALTLSGDLLGTPRYMSPEQTRGAVAAGPASDQFSLGVMMYELLTGKLPFEGADMRTLLNAIAEKDPPRPTQVNPRVHRDAETICLKALEKDPSRRYASLSDLAADVGRYLDGEPIAARPAGGLSRLARKARRHWAVTLPSAAAVVVGAAFAVYAVRMHFLHVREQATLVQQLTAANQRAERALDQERAEKQALEKGILMTKVLLRWGGLSVTLAELEREYFDVQTSREAKRASAERLWPKVDEFIRGTPGDSTSQATMKALSGWALCLASREEEGLAWMDEAARIDPDVPYGPLMKALVRFSDYVTAIHLPTICISHTGLRFEGRPTESTSQRALALEVASLLDRVTGCPAWGREGAESTEEVVEGIQAMGRGEFPRAEEALTRALAAAEMAPFASWLLLARVKVRYLRFELGAAIEDLTEVDRRRPHYSQVALDLGHLKLAQATEVELKGGDPRPLLDEAIASYGEVLVRDPSIREVLGNRANALLKRGQAELDRGGTPATWFRAAIEDYGGAIESEPDQSVTRSNRGAAYFRIGEWEGATGVNPIADFEKAIADFDVAIRLDPKSAPALSNRGYAHVRLAEAVGARGGDPRERLGRAIVDLESARAIDAGDPGLWLNLGNAHLDLGQDIERHGQDPREQYEKACHDLDEAIRLKPDFPAARSARSLARDALARRQAALGEDPSKGFEGAVEDLRVALRLTPSNVNARINLGCILVDQGQYEASRGRDARTTFERAAAEFAEALRLNPRSAIALHGRSNAWQAIGELEGRLGLDPRVSLRKAIEDLTQALAINPEQEGSYLNRGNAWVALAEAEGARGEDPRPDLSKAVADFGEATRRNPRDQSPFNGRGLARVALGHAKARLGEGPEEDFRKATEDYGRALALNPSSAPALINRAEAWLLLARLEGRIGGGATRARALEDAAGAIRVAPSMWQAYGIEGQALEFSGRHAEAAEAYAAGIRIVGEGHSPLDGWLAWARAASEGKPEWMKDLTAAETGARKGDLAGAIEAYERILPGVRAVGAERALLAVGWYDLACVRSLASTGRAYAVSPEQAEVLRRRALDALSTAIECGWGVVETTAVEGDLAPLHSDPRWSAILARMAPKPR